MACVGVVSKISIFYHAVLLRDGDRVQFPQPEPGIDGIDPDFLGQFGNSSTPGQTSIASYCRHCHVIGVL